jgi:hypothetical protein
MQGDDPVLRAVEQMVEEDPDFRSPPGEGRKLLDEIFRLVHLGIRVVPHHLAVAARDAGFSAPDVLGLAWQRKDGKINETEYRAALRKELSSVGRREREDLKKREELQRREQPEEARCGEQLPVATDDEMRQFHLWREAEEDRKRVCPALPKAELRGVLAALCKRDWTRKGQWVRVESLRRWLAMSPEAIRKVAGSGRWKSDIARGSPESRRLGGQLPRELSSPGQGRWGGRPGCLLGPRAVARVLRAYAGNGGELGPQIKQTAATLDRIGR